MGRLGSVRHGTWWGRPGDCGRKPAAEQADTPTIDRPLRPCRLPVWWSRPTHPEGGFGVSDGASTYDLGPMGMNVEDADKDAMHPVVAAYDPDGDGFFETVRHSAE